MSAEDCDKLEGLVSVIVPVYNSAAWLRECIDSISAQTYKRLEIILVDDGSTDGSGQICDEYMLADNRVRVVHQANCGVGAARNKGLEVAAGDYIGWVDADDIIEPEMFECLMAAAADVSACAFISFGNGREAVCRCGACGVYVHPRIMEVMAHIPVLWNKLSRRELWKDLRFPPCRVMDDEAVNCSLLARAQSLAVTEKPLYRYRIHRSGLSTNYRAEDCLPALDAACAGYTEMKKLNREISIYFLSCVYYIFRACRQSINGRRSYRRIRGKITQAAALISESRKELGNCLGLGFLGRLEILALTRGSYWSCRFSRLCKRLYVWNNKRRQRNDVGED